MWLFGYVGQGQILDPFDIVVSKAEQLPALITHCRAVPADFIT